jgi:hypothetical protein
MIQLKRQQYFTRNPQIVTIVKTMLACNSKKFYTEHSGKAPRSLNLFTTVSRFHAAILHSGEIKARITLSRVLLFLLRMWELPGLNLCPEASYLV